MPDEVARIGALSNGSNGQRSLESASLHFEPICKRERGASRVGACRRNPERAQRVEGSPVWAALRALTLLFDAHCQAWARRSRPELYSPNPWAKRGSLFYTTARSWM